MTREEVQNSLEMKIVQREMVKKFPFIIDIKITDDFEENDALYEYVYFSKITISNSKYWNNTHIGNLGHGWRVG